MLYHTKLEMVQNYFPMVYIHFYKALRRDGNYTVPFFKTSTKLLKYVGIIKSPRPAEKSLPWKFSSLSNYRYFKFYQINNSDLFTRVEDGISMLFSETI